MSHNMHYVKLEECAERLKSLSSWGPDLVRKTLDHASIPRSATATLGTCLVATLGANVPPVGRPTSAVYLTGKAQTKHAPQRQLPRHTPPPQLRSRTQTSPEGGSR